MGTDSIPSVISDDSNKKRQAGRQEPDYNDFKEDPEIEVCEMSMNIESKDSRNIRDITSGRMVRKPTRQTKSMSL